MYCVHVEFQIKPDQFEAFMRRMRQQRDDSLALEPQCREFHIWTGGSAHNEVMLYEIYDSPEAFQVHLDSGHFKSFDADVAAMTDHKNARFWERQE